MGVPPVRSNHLPLGIHFSKEAGFAIDKVGGLAVRGFADPSAACVILVLGNGLVVLLDFAQSVGSVVDLSLCGAPLGFGLGVAVFGIGERGLDIALPPA